MRKSLGSIVLLLATISGIALAENASGRLGIGGWGGWTDAGATGALREATNDGKSWGVNVRYGVSPQNEIALSYDQFRLENRGNTNSPSFQPILLNLIHSFPVDSALIPFVSIGAGPTVTTHMDSVNRKDIVFGAKAGLGLEYFVSKNVSFGALGSYHYASKSDTNSTNEASVFSAGIMANLFFTKSTRETPPVKAEAPAPAPVAAVAAPVAVAAVDTEKDSDNDGVMDTLDKCADTPAGVLVDTTGCPAEKVTVTLDVKFETGKSVVDTKYDPQLAKGAAFMKSRPSVTVEIEGHSDNVGDKAQNKALSLKRAEAVRQALITRHGADASRLTAVGYGDEQPIADNATPEGREINRRVMATITATPQ